MYGPWPSHQHTTSGAALVGDREDRRTVFHCPLFGLIPLSSTNGLICQTLVPRHSWPHYTHVTLIAHGLDCGPVRL